MLGCTSDLIIDIQQPTRIMPGGSVVMAGILKSHPHTAPVVSPPRQLVRRP